MLISLLVLGLLLLLTRYVLKAWRAPDTEKINMRSLRSLQDVHSRGFFENRISPDERSQSFSAGSKGCVNLRDCGLVCDNLRTGCVFRSSQVVSSAEIRNLRLGAVLDLRVLKKPCKKREDELLLQRRVESRNQLAAQRQQQAAAAATGGALRPSVSSSSDEDSCATSGLGAPGFEAGGGCTACDICSEEFGRRHRVYDVPVYHSDMVPWQAKMRVFGKLPVRTQAAALRELCHLRNPTNLVAAAVVDPAVMGPTVLYRVLLDHSRPSLARAMRVFARRENYPVLVHCIHGKDRTGLVVMLLLLLCDVPAELVVRDYIQSEMQLKAGRDKGELAELDDFLKTDNVIASKADTMQETISHIERTYGGARGYCRAIGLSESEVASIRTNFMKQAETTDLLDRMPSMPAMPSTNGLFPFTFGVPPAAGGGLSQRPSGSSTEQSASPPTPVTLLEAGGPPVAPPGQSGHLLDQPAAVPAEPGRPAGFWPAPAAWAAPQPGFQQGVPVAPGLNGH